MTMRYARAALSGWVRPSSQSCSVRTLKPYSLENSDCDSPSFDA
jgi:hypothetical protein